MAKYIDVERFQVWLSEKVKNRVVSMVAAETAADLLRYAPLVDVQEVKHGKWIFDPECGITKCSVCKWSIEEYFTNPSTRKPYKRCPECGAVMDLE